MRAFVRIVHVVALAVLMPTIAFAQATITGTVKDTSGAVLPGSPSKRAAQHAHRIHRKSPHRRHRWQRSIPYRRPSAWNVLLGDVHSAWFQHLQARRRRAGRRPHRDDQRGPQGRVARRDRDGHGRKPDRRRAEHTASDRHQRRRDEGSACGAIVRRRHDADSIDDHPGRCEPRHPGHAGHVGVRRRRRTQQRSAHSG